MKNSGKFLVAVLVVMVSLPLLQSCKKGEGDPYLSIYSRKHRLCNDWKVTFLNKVVTYRNTTVTTSFDGTKKSVEIWVRDTVIYTATDTLYEYRHTDTYTGSLNFSFEKAGNYQIDESFTDDSTQIQYTSQETGYWYFTGGNALSDTKPKELLALQPDQFVYNPLNPDTYTFTYTGQMSMNVYHIYQLASKDLELRFNTDETNNLFQIVTEEQIKLEPR